MTPFQRDFRDLHGRAPRHSDFIHHEDVRDGRLVRRTDRPGLRLVMGALGLWAGIVLLVALAAMVVVTVVLVAGLFDPAQLGPSP